MDVGWLEHSTLRLRCLLRGGHRWLGYSTRVDRYFCPLCGRWGRAVHPDARPAWAPDSSGYTAQPRTLNNHPEQVGLLVSGDPTNQRPQSAESAQNHGKVPTP